MDDELRFEPTDLTETPGFVEAAWAVPSLTFASPWWLLALVVPAALLVWTWRRRAGRTVLPLDRVGPAATRRSGRFLDGLLRVGEMAPACLLAVAVIILAGPQATGRPRDRRVLTNIEFAVDVSGSMLAPFGDGCRYDASMEAIQQFLGAREGDAFGLTFFGSSVLHWTPLTKDTSAIRCAVPFMHPSKVPYWYGGTEIGKALLACRKLLVEREEGDRLIVLVSDGYSADLGGGEENQIGERLAADGITVYAIHVGGGDPPPEIAVVCKSTGGDVFAADDPGTLPAVFARIDAMQKTRLVKTTPEARDAFGPWAAVGLAVVTGLVGIALTLRPTPW